VCTSLIKGVERERFVRTDERDHIEPRVGVVECVGDGREGVVQLCRDGVDLAGIQALVIVFSFLGQRGRLLEEPHAPVHAVPLDAQTQPAKQPFPPTLIAVNCGDVDGGDDEYG